MLLYPPVSAWVSLKPPLDFKAALLSALNEGICSEIRRAIDSERQGEAMGQPLLMEPVHIVGQSPRGREHHFRRRDGSEDHPKSRHASRIEDRRRVLTLGVGDHHAVDVEEDDGGHGQSLSGCPEIVTDCPIHRRTCFQSAASQLPIPVIQ